MDASVELAPYSTDLLLSLRWFRQARDCAQSGQLQAAAYCCDRGLQVLDRVERAVLKDREKAETTQREA
jgi:hypothetical protein